MTQCLTSLFGANVERPFIVDQTSTTISVEYTVRNPDYPGAHSYTLQILDGEDNVVASRFTEQDSSRGENYTFKFRLTRELGTSFFPDEEYKFRLVGNSAPVYLFGATIDTSGTGAD